MLSMDDKTWPLGQVLPGLRALVERLQLSPEPYLMGEYHSAHQPLDVGPCPPSRPWRRQAMAELCLHLGAASEDDANEFSTSLGLLAIDADFMGALKGSLADWPESLGWLLDQSSLELEDMLMRLSL
jgi:hypothetical protein